MERKQDGLVPIGEAFADLGGPVPASQILGDGPAFGGRARRVVSDHAGGFPVPGQHDFRG